MKNNFLTVAVGLLLSGCTIAQAPEASSFRDDGENPISSREVLHVPYPLFYSWLVDGLKGSGRYDSGRVFSPWMTYRVTLYPWKISRLRYRLEARIVLEKDGFGFRTKVPVQEMIPDSAGSPLWRTVGEDAKRAKKFKLDLTRWLSWERSRGQFEMEPVGGNSSETNF